MVFARLCLFACLVMCWTDFVAAQRDTRPSIYKHDMSGVQFRRNSGTNSTSSYWAKPNDRNRADAGKNNEGRIRYGSRNPSQQESPNGSAYDDELDPDEPNEDAYSDDNANTEQALIDWPEKTIFEIRLDPRDFHDKVPSDNAARLLQSYARDWHYFECRQKFLAWDAPNICYHPLYFEDVALERYGQVACNDYWQTAKSATHFFSSFLLWPLHARYDPVFSCEYPLGYCRPGSCAQSIYERKIWR